MIEIYNNNKSVLERQFYLADWYVDTITNRVIRGEQEVKLEHKVMAVLTYLVQHKGELVSREALEQAIWGQTIVGYDALTRCIAKLRKVLNDDPRHPQYIETISKKGYRLIAPVSVEDRHHKNENRHINHNQPTSTYKRYWWQIGIAVLVLAAIFTYVNLQRGSGHRNALPNRTVYQPTIVILPFTNLSNDPNQDYFSDGMTNDITTALSKLSGLNVISHSSTTGYRNSPRDVKQIANSLNVRYVLEGSIRRKDKRLRINTHLIDASSNIYLWSEKYDREIRNVFDVQDDITNNIVNALSIKLTEEEKRRVSKKYTVSLEAYDDFLRGQALYFHHNQKDNLLARHYYQQAIDRDNTFARAYSAMALTYTAEHRNNWSNILDTPLPEALRLAQKGVAIDPELPQAYWVLAYVQLFRHDYQKAKLAATRALELNPNFADSYLTLAICNIHFGSPDEAVRLIRKAMLLNPAYPAAYASILGQAYFIMGQYELSVSMLRVAVERNINLLTPHVFLITALNKLGRSDEAIWAAEELKIIAPDFTLSSLDRLLAIHDMVVLEDMKNQLRDLGL